MNTSAKILCVEREQLLRESRCKVIESAGYDTMQTNPREAIGILTSQKFDLIVISGVSELEMNRILNVSDGAEVLVLSGFVHPWELLPQVAARLKHVRSSRT